jgi:hypothetical protein
MSVPCVMNLMECQGENRMRKTCLLSSWSFTSHGNKTERTMCYMCDARYNGSHGVLPLSWDGRCLIDSTSCTTYWFTPPLFNNSSGDKGRWNSYSWGGILLPLAHRTRNQTAKKPGYKSKMSFYLVQLFPLFQYVCFFSLTTSFYYFWSCERRWSLGAWLKGKAPSPKP